MRRRQSRRMVPALHTRRQFIRASVAGLSAALVAGQVGCGRKGKRTVVIGAGISGLAAASRLRALGFHVVVLEARERIGGRIHSTKFGGATLDVGASWIHGITGNPLYDLAQQIGAETVATDFDSESIFDRNGTEITNAEWREVEGYMDLLYQAVDAEPDRSLQAVLDDFEPGLGLNNRMTRLFRLAVRILVEIPYAVDAPELAASMASWENSFPGQNVTLRDGMSRLPASLATGLDIRYGTFVSEVFYDSHRVLLRTTPAAPLSSTQACGGCHEGAPDPPGYNDVMTADRVVVTVPLGLFKSGMIRFEPELPKDKLGAIERLGVGTMNKVLLKFDRRFWPEATSFFSTMKEDRSQVMEFWNTAPAGIPKTLVAFLAGDQARHANVWTENAVRQLVMDDLRVMFGQSIPEPVEFARSEWHTDLFALGSYPHLEPGSSLSDCDVMARPVDDRLFFAGDATDSQYVGTAHGAYLSGLRAATEVSRAAS